MIAVTCLSTPGWRTVVTKPMLGTAKKRAARPVSLDTTHPNGFVAAAIEKCWSRFDNCGGEMHDVFIVISKGGDGEPIARTVLAADEKDARQTHREIYVDDTIVAVHQ